jgi:hypothetical protein
MAFILLTAGILPFVFLYKVDFPIFKYLTASFKGSLFQKTLLSVFNSFLTYNLSKVRCMSYNCKAKQNLRKQQEGHL